MRVLLVTTWGTACGIAEHSAHLKEAVEKADPTIEIGPCWELNPGMLMRQTYEGKIIHLNYHAALHSRWTPDWVRKFQEQGCKVVITYHDTGVPNSQQCLDLYAVADAFVVHESCDDLPEAHYWRQGIPVPETFPYDHARRLYPHQPVVGSVGFPFPWKNYDLLAEASYAAGWGLILLAPNATSEQVETWKRLNPWSYIESSFVHRMQVLEHLTACDATAFLYANANTGTSAAIRQGIAARKPVLATVSAGCRQFRDLDDSDAHRAITWLPKLDVDHIVEALSLTRIQKVDPQVARLAHLDSWERNGQRYAQLYRSLVS